MQLIKLSHLLKDIYKAVERDNHKEAMEGINNAMEFVEPYTDDYADIPLMEDILVNVGKLVWVKSRNKELMLRSIKEAQVICQEWIKMRSWNE